jgi:hypothetical protein
VPYVQFWRHYVATHASSGSSFEFDPAALVAVSLCLFVLACWAAHQIQSRCATCGAWPVRCRCPGGHTPA